MPPKVTELVDRMVRVWDAQRDRSRKSLHASRRQGPMIAVSRQYIAGQGLDIAHDVAERLGFQLYEREIVEAIAQSAGVRKRVVESVDARVREMISEQITHLAAAGQLSESTYLDHLGRVLLVLAQHGRGVIVGRGAQFLLDPERTLRVRLIAPHEQRVAQVARTQRLSLEDALVRVERSDIERAVFCRTHFRRDIDDPQCYDMVLNVGFMTHGTCVALTVRAFRDRFRIELHGR